MNTNFSDYITDCVRVLVLIDSAGKYKTIKLTDNRIKLYDYYYKFPYTMLGDEVKEYGVELNVDEYYSFFHWQPDIIKYRQIINYLIAKGFVKSTDNNDKVYSITDIGKEVLNKIENPYKDRLLNLSDLIMKTVKQLSDTKINEEIRRKNNIMSRKGWES